MNRFARLIPSRRWLVLPPIFVGIGIIAALASSKKELNRVEVSETATPLRVVSASLSPLQARATGFGTATPNRRWTAVAEVGGQISETISTLRSGIPVEKGDVLLVIDQADYELQRRQREADLVQAKSQLDQLRLNQASDERLLEIQQDLLKIRRNEVERFAKLQESSAASESEYDSAQAMFLQQRQTVQTLINSLTTYPARISSAEAAIETAAARLQEADRNLARTKIIAPFDGLLSDVNLEQGQYVAPGQSLFEVVDMSSVEIEAQFSMAQLADVLNQPNDQFSANNRTPSSSDTENLPQGNRSQTISNPARKRLSNSLALNSLGDLGNQSASSTPVPTTNHNNAQSWTRSPIGIHAEVTIRSGDMTMTFPGRPLRFTSALDEQTRTLGIIVRVDNPDGTSGDSPEFASQIRIGSYCEVTLVADQPTQTFSVPRTSVDEDAVFVVDSSNRLHRRPIKIAFTLSDVIAVSDGLVDGELVVVNPSAIMMEGELVEPIRDDTARETAPENSLRAPLDYPPTETSTASQDGERPSRD